MSEAGEKRNRRPISLTTWIVAGLLCGLLSGLFFGETLSWIKWVGDAFVGLLQMTVLPYVAVSLAANIGRLSVGTGFRLMRVGLLVLGMLWLVGLVSLWIMSQAFPAWATGSFFSSRFVEEPPAANWLELFIPSNPFYSLANNAIPAVVVFAIGVGIALMNLPGKKQLLAPLDVLVDALANLNRLVVRLSPAGLFAIVAYTAGTLDLAEFSLIQGYLITYACTALILTLVVLPALVASFTPWSWWMVVRASSNALIAAFIIGNSFVVLPMIIDATRRLQREAGGAELPDDNAPEYLVPMAYPFPDVGRIAGLVFIPFAAWFYGTVIDQETWLPLTGVGLLGSFGKPVVTIPLLLDIAELPSDIINLYLASGVVAARFGDLMKTMHLMAFTILAMSFMSGSARLQPVRLATGLVMSLLLLAGMATGIRVYLDSEFKDRYSKEQMVTDRDLLFPLDRQLSKVRVTILESGGPNPEPLAAGQTRIGRIRQRGIIRIGFDPQTMPFSYYSAAGELIGFDVELMYYLADDLGVDIEFVPLQRDSLFEDLNHDHFDIVISAQEGTVHQAAQLPSIEPYMTVTLAIVVRDHDKHYFRTVDRIFARDDLKLGVIRGSYFAERAARVFSRKSDIEFVPLESAGEFFDEHHRDLDGLVINAESGSAWTLRNPGFAVANPVEGRIQVPLYFLTARDIEFETFLKNWMTLKHADDTWQNAYDYWILGLDPEDKDPRWCVARDVLGWIE